MKPKILLFDLENAPLTGRAWEIWEANILETTEDWYTLSIAYKWFGEKKTKCVALCDFPSYKKNKHNDKPLMKVIHELFDEADIVIAHNGDRFDIRKANARFIAHGMKPPSPYKTIDTLKLARKYFKFDSNKLDALGRYLKVGRKIVHTGYNLWQGCMAGNPKSWKVMKKYNIQDVELLERVYLKLGAWGTLPKMYPSNLECEVPTCRSKKFIRQGRKLYAKNKFRQKYQCSDCGAWFSGPLETKK